MRELAAHSHFLPFRLQWPKKPYKVHILGHSFVKRLKKDLEASFDTRADLRLRGTANVELFGVGGLTPDALVANDLLVISRSAPDILVLETGTNDLAQSRPETAGSKIEELIMRLVDAFYVKIIAVCQVIPRGPSSDATFEAFNETARVLNGNHARTSLRFLLETQRLQQPQTSLVTSGRSSLKPVGPI